MDSIKLATGGSRRHLALGVWSLLLVTLMLWTSELSLAVATCLTLVISIASGMSLLLVEKSEDEHPPRPVVLPDAAIAIALLIPLLWSLKLSQQNLAFTRALLALASITGPGVAAMIGPTHLSLPRRNRVSAAPGSAQAASPDVDLEEAADERTEERERLDEVSCETSLDDVPLTESAAARLFKVSAEPFSEDVTQWLTRSRSCEGEQISGGVRVEFAPGERDVIVHLSFCPAFNGVPQIETEDFDGAGLEIRVAAVFPFGARLTVRQTSQKSAEAGRSSRLSCCIGFTATCSAARRAA